ncbi:uncharacterized protein LOC119829985 isoform X2 [Zerene cesonia]|uniref:uncharacterized protein LOC119829985 isoform X2 n=1 Tax=Zerene cesonia TaxID=33412 RepID=UPI0018E5778B|nr:uncharacterized protein LOC119829985 isoform X2 [Zerene cesonia]
MTSEIDVSRTNEFQRRRKLRLQQVREQSKDIAKKIRQRAKVEKLRHVINVDAKKEKDYFDLQEKLVGRLEQLYSQSLENVGAGHKDASNIKEADNEQKKDLSKLRGREAVAELRKRKQEKLDEQKKILDRKLQAREAANEISREKGVLLSKTLGSKSADNLQSNNIDVCSDNIEKDKNTDKPKNSEDTNIAKNDMGTQWEGDEPGNEWAPCIPALSLPNDKDSLKDSGHERDKADHNKRINLFALSDEMPSSLRGGPSSTVMNVPQQKPSMTLISEYLQSRSLRLRENEPVTSTKKTDDLQSIKQTILRSRSSRPDVSVKSDKSKRERVNTLNKKNSVSMYNHSTRDTHEIIYNKDKLVVREQNAADDDAYIKALKESSIAQDVENKQLEIKKQEMRNKVAMTKERVDKEYKDTLAFLNTLSKETTSRTQKIAYMDSERQEMQKEKHQKKLQDEFRRIERECKRNCKHTRNQSISINKSRCKSRSPDKFDNNNDALPRNFQYDWMPVPESDGMYAVHTIPSTANPKSSNTVKFNDIDTYHEYRSRHKHTPPTKEGSKDRERKRVVETVIIEQNSNESTDASSVISDTSSMEQGYKTRTDKDRSDDPGLSDGDRIVIYKILDSKRDKKCRSDKKSKAINKIFKSLSTTEKANKVENKERSQQQEQRNVTDKLECSDLDNLNEGIYKVSENGDNIASMYFTESNRNTSTYKVPDATQKLRESNSSKHDKILNGFEPSKDNNVTQSRNRHSCSGCKCACSNTYQPQTSAATSTSSFQTATNDKAPHGISDDGFLKIINDGHQDAGKFYIGASGFLKDNNYEVVIQLKKKETDKLEGKSQELNVNVIDDSPPLPPPPPPSHVLSKVDTEVQSSFCNNLKESSAQTSVNKELTTENEILLHSKSEPILVTKAAEQSTSQRNALVGDKDTNNKSDTVVDKGIHTSFHDSFAIPENVTKVDPVSRPATSTYTQTSFSSPNSRPVFMHMTSSTSTAYMSPPEVIIPRFLKENRSPSNTADLLINDNFSKLNERGCSKQNKHCKWKHQTRNISTEKVRKCQSRHICSTTDTPPNTAHSYDYNGSWSENVESEKYTHTLHGKKCRKSNKYKNNFSLHKSSSKLICGSNSTAVLSKKNIKKISNIHQLSSTKSGFNPVVQQYVNKLLLLNKESLKAIQVVNQECSAVDTPGSSIIYNPLNTDSKDLPIQNQISLEQIKIMLEQQIFQEQHKRQQKYFEIPPKFMFRLPRKKPVHKVKSLNISKRFLRNRQFQDIQRESKVRLEKCNKAESSSSSAKVSSTKQLYLNKDKDASDVLITKNKNRSSSPTPRNTKNYASGSINNVGKPTTRQKEPLFQASSHYSSDGTHCSKEDYKLHLDRCTITPMTSDSEQKLRKVKNTSHNPPTDISTQTSGIDSEINFMKLAENKLQNMEKIADLTDKCTKRLSNLAKVLEEVRRNKSLVYSHLSNSDTTSDSENKNIKRNENIPEILSKDNILTNVPKAPLKFPEKDKIDEDNYVPLLGDIPKPLTPSTLSLSTISEKSNLPTTIKPDQTKMKARPPPALTRVNLKNVQDFYAAPHELSTVIEVDSPMSIKQKNHSSRREISQELPCKINEDDNEKQLNKRYETHTTNETGLDLVDSKGNSSKRPSSSDSADNAKIQMMDMKLFNDIMLKPFLSLQEYAKQCDVHIDEGSNIEEVFKDEHIQEELSSLHSDGSLPDVISELIKRKIITEPFKFDTASHVNSTSMSSESSLSLLALSKIRKERKKINKFAVNKENMAETSETLSISSNPDLENAFQKLGMGWASSTLKKTKERLALSSSSNTSSSSLSHLKFKSFNKELPTITTESTISEQNDSNKNTGQPRKMVDNSKNAEQQTSLINSMTVKEFLTNELAKKIIFTNKSNKTGDDEFVSLYETKMPEEIKNTTEMCEDDKSLASQSNNRARTSTPVQIYKSNTYQSSSSTNTSNGLFSNADELSSVKVTSTSIRNHSTSDKEDLTIPNYSLKRKGLSDCSKSE